LAGLVAGAAIGALVIVGGVYSGVDPAMVVEVGGEVVVGTGPDGDGFGSDFIETVVDAAGMAVGEVDGMVVGVLGLLVAVELGPGGWTGLVSS